MNERKWSSDSKQMILDAVILFFENHGYSPTIREICDMTGLTSTSSVHYHISRLVAEGKLNIGDYKSSRTITVPGYKFMKEDSNEQFDN